MKYIETEGSYPVLELTRRNLNALLEKLSDPLSNRTLIDPTDKIAVRSVEDRDHYSGRPPGEVCISKTRQVLFDFGVFLAEELEYPLTPVDLYSILDEYNMPCAAPNL